MGYSKGYVIIYDLDSSEQSNAAIPEENVDFIHKFNSHSQQKEAVGITCLCFKADGSLLLSGSKDTTICIYDLLEGRPLFKFVGHKESITKVVFRGNDEIVSSSLDGTLKVWSFKD